ncbi:MAG: hypothetical protein IIX66_00845, partial [Alistipes sp.]|nr:hypothetical protein [Alistipes sp.]
MKQEPFIHKIDNEQTAQLPAIEFRGKSAAGNFSAGFDSTLSTLNSAPTRPSRNFTASALVLNLRSN